MKRIEILIPDSRLHDINSVLKEAKIRGMIYGRVDEGIEVGGESFIDERGFAHYMPEFVAGLKVEVVVRDEQVDQLVSKILEDLGGDPYTGGKIFVIDVPVAIDLFTGKKGDSVGQR
jgi:nitrogen regulatory protein P-II 1